MIVFPAPGSSARRNRIGAVGGNGHILLRVDEEEDPRERWTERSMDRTHKLNQDGERLDAQSEPLRITIEGSRLRSCFQRRYLGGIKYWLVAWPVTNPFPTSLMDVPIGIDTMTCTGFREEWSTHDYIGLDLLNSHIDLANHFQGVRERKTLF